MKKESFKYIDFDEYKDKFVLFFSKILKISKMYNQNILFVLSGPLGSGKTFLVKEIIKQMVNPNKIFLNDSFIKTNDYVYFNESIIKSNIDFFELSKEYDNVRLWFIENPRSVYEIQNKHTINISFSKKENLFEVNVNYD